MGQEQSMNPKLEAEAKKICAVQKAFAAAFKECIAKHTSSDAHAAHAKRLSAADELSDSVIRDELKRQATQFMCADERVKLESCCAPNSSTTDANPTAPAASSTQDNNSDKAAELAPPQATAFASTSSRVPAACESLQKAFLSCVADRTTAEEILDYRDKAKEAHSLLFIRREAAKEKMNATRLHFSF